MMYGKRGAVGVSKPQLPRRRQPLALGWEMTLGRSGRMTLSWLGDVKPWAGTGLVANQYCSGAVLQPSFPRHAPVAFRSSRDDGTEPGHRDGGARAPDDFNLTLTPSTGAPQVFEKGDAEDRGDGLLSFKVTDPQPGVLYSATVTLEAGGVAVTLFEAFELHALLLEQGQPDRPATPPPFEDPFVFVTDTEDPDADSQPELEVDDDIAEYWESQRREFVFG